uniref:GrpE protein homolog n=1 Tax=Sciurus vulgaris TaxID=55149 RepID=A0A8D2ACV2_SCIVU
MQIKTTLRFHLIPIRIGIVKNASNNSWRGCGEKGTLIHCWWGCKLVQSLWKAVWRFLRKLGMEPPFDPAIPLFGLYPKNLLEEKVKLEEQLRDTMEKYKRALADTENVRQRSQKLVEEAKLYGIQGFCKDLLEVADILEKATQSVPEEEIQDDNPHLKSLYEGLVLTEAQIQKVFTKHGLLRLDPLGAKFDPYEHEALFHTPVEGKEPGTVALVSKVGYKLHGRTLRPALVGVVKEA